MSVSPTTDPNPDAQAPTVAIRGAHDGVGGIVAVLRRLALLLVLLLVLSFGIFSLQAAAPGSAVDALLGQGTGSSAQHIAALKARYGLDEPFVEQYLHWLQRAARGDLGDSVQSAQPVTQLLRERAGVTLFLIAYATAIVLIFGVSFGVMAALRHGTAVDRGLTSVGLAGVSVPAFVSGLVLLYLFGVLVRLFPSSGAGAGFTDRVNHLTLPAIALAFTSIGYIMRITRTSMISALGQDFVTFARARGLRARTIVVHYALRNALIPVIAASALVFTAFVTSTVLVEVTFSIPGVGSLLVSSIQTQDVPVVQGTALAIGIAVVVVNLVAEILYVVADPRIRSGASA